MTGYHEHTADGPEDCRRCALLRENAHWMAPGGRTSPLVPGTARDITLTWRRISQDIGLRGHATEQDEADRDLLLAMAARLPEDEQERLSGTIRDALAVRLTSRTRESFTRLLLALVRFPGELTPDDQAAALDSADGLFGAGRQDLAREILPLLADAKAGDRQALLDAMSLAYSVLPPEPSPRSQAEAQAYQRGRRDLSREVLRLMNNPAEAGQCLADIAVLAHAEHPQAGPPDEDATRPVPAVLAVDEEFPGRPENAAADVARLAADIVAEASALGVHFQVPFDGMTSGQAGLFISLEDILALLPRLSPFRGLAGSQDADVLRAAARLTHRYGNAEPDGPLIQLVRDTLIRLAARARELGEPARDAAALPLVRMHTACGHGAASCYPDQCLVTPGEGSPA